MISTIHDVPSDASLYHTSVYAGCELPARRLLVDSPSAQILRYRNQSSSLLNFGGGGVNFLDWKRSTVLQLQGFGWEENFIRANRQ